MEVSGKRTGGWPPTANGRHGIPWQLRKWGGPPAIDDKETEEAHLLPQHTYRKTHTDTQKHTYKCVCVCACIWVKRTIDHVPRSYWQILAVWIENRPLWKETIPREASWWTKTTAMVLLCKRFRLTALQNDNQRLSGKSSAAEDKPSRRSKNNKRKRKERKLEWKAKTGLHYNTQHAFTYTQKYVLCCKRRINNAFPYNNNLFLEKEHQGQTQNRQTTNPVCMCAVEGGGVE